MKLILASNSKQRQNIFNMMGWKYQVVTSNVEEISNAKNPDEYVMELSKRKAESVSLQVKEKAIIIAGDTVIYMNGKIYEKPKSKEEAYLNLKEMSGKVNYAITGTTIKDLYQNKEMSFSDTTEIHFKEMEDDEIRWYVENEKNILDISGYAMEGKAAIFLDKINGDYYNLIGISPSKILDKLKELGYTIKDFETN